MAILSIILTALSIIVSFAVGILLVLCWHELRTKRLQDEQDMEELRERTAQRDREIACLHSLQDTMPLYRNRYALPPLPMRPTYD